MWKKVNRWAKDNPLTLTIAVLGVSFVLQRNTVALGSLWSGWQQDIMWVILSLGWIVVFGALALLSLNMWAEFDARLRERRQAREDLDKERENCEEEHQLAVKIWQECQDDIAAMHGAEEEGDRDQFYALTAGLAGKLRGLDPYLDDYISAFEEEERMWVWAVREIIERTDPSAEALDRIRTKARINLVFLST